MNTKNITISELRRVLHAVPIQYRVPDKPWAYIPACDCDGGEPLNICNSKCRINVIYHKIFYLRSSLPKTTYMQDYISIIGMVNQLDLDDVLCPICMDRMSFFAGCPDLCNISLCVECAKTQSSCPLCRKSYPAYMKNVIQRTNPNQTK